MTSDNDDVKMQETMHEINSADAPARANKRDSLKMDISNLKRDIKNAEEAIQKGKDDNPYTPISPEKANENKREIVFLKKDLEKKKIEYDQLDEHILL